MVIASHGEYRKPPTDVGLSCVGAGTGDNSQKVQLLLSRHLSQAGAKIEDPKQDLKNETGSPTGNSWN